MRNLILFLFLSIGLYAQDCNYAINKNGILETQSEALAYNKDLSGIMATARREGNFKYLELFMFLPKKAAFDKGNTFILELQDGKIATGIFAQDGTTTYSDAVGYHSLKIKVYFSDEYYEMMSTVPVAKIKMRANSDDLEMMPVGNSNKFMQIIKCIL